MCRENILNELITAVILNELITAVILNELITAVILKIRLFFPPLF